MEQTFQLARNVYREEAFEEAGKTYDEHLAVIHLAQDTDNFILSLRVKEKYLNEQNKLLGHFLNYVLQASIELNLQSGFHGGK